MMTGLNEMMGLSGNARYGLSLTASAIRTEYAALGTVVGSRRVKLGVSERCQRRGLGLFSKNNTR